MFNSDFFFGFKNQPGTKIGANQSIGKPNFETTKSAVIKKIVPKNASKNQPECWSSKKGLRSNLPKFGRLMSARKLRM